MILTVMNVDKSFGDNYVLKKVNLKAESGKALGILGRNGAGKTTTIRIIMGVFPADRGYVLIDKKEIDRSRVEIGYLPEERGLYPKKVIIDQLIYFGMLKGMNKKDALASANYWLERLEMTEYAKSKLETLSKGNQQKIQLIVALIADPKIVILDEPFSGLDPVNAILLKNIVKELIEQDKIVLFSSHQMNYIEEFCDNIAILNDGEIVLSGEIREIKRNYDRNKIVIQSLDFHNIVFFTEETCKDIVKSIEKLKDNTVVLTLFNEYHKEKLVQRLAEQHFDIDKFEVYEPTLNDIFVEYTEDRI